MRSFRWLAVGCAVLLPAIASGQSERGFRDSWFWGVKGGMASFSTEAVDNATAPSVGGEWLITRSRFGLYLAGDIAFFDEQAVVAGRTGPEVVQVSDLRRATAAALFFPKAFGTLRPYAGLGLALNWIGEATPTREFTDLEMDEAKHLASKIEDRKDASTFVMMGGVQGQIGRVVPFVQATLQPSQARFLLGDRPAVFVEGGIRINFGSAIEREP